MGDVARTPPAAEGGWRRGDDAVVLPMSYSQRQLWYLQRLNPASTAYNIPFAVHVEGALDVPALERAFTTLANRHEALRTTYGLVGGEPRQILHGEVALTLHPEPCEGWSDEQVREAVEAEARTPFDLRLELPVRVRVLRRGEDAWVVLWTLHHIAVDHIAVLELGRALARAYGAETGGAPEPEPDGAPALQYADYAVWQHEELAGGDEMERRLDHWRRHLEGAPTVLDLPLDRPRPSTQAFVGRELGVRLDPALRQPVLDAARAAGVSPFAFLLSAFKVTVGAYAGVRDVITGAPFANRSRLELEEVVGLFMNLLPIRVAWSDETTVAELLQATRSAVAEGQRYQDTPFEKIVEGLGVPADPAVNPLVQTWFTFQEPPLQLELPGLETRTEHPHNGGAKLDLSAWLWDGGTAFEGTFEFDTTIFDAETVGWLIDVYERVLRQMAEDPDAALGTLSFRPPAHDRLVEEWQGGPPADGAGTLAEGLRRSFAAHGERFAVRGPDERLRYGELSDRAAAVAAALRAAGLGPGEHVGVCLERSVDLLAALVGVAFTGAAYVPLDPRYPEARLRHIVEDSGAARVLADASTVDLVRDVGGEPILVEEALDAPADALPETAPDPADPAYLIYTSGSTGVPKGVVVPHRAVASFLSAMASRPGCRTEDVVAAVTTLSFDISVLELFLPLWVGAECVIVGDRAARNGDTLARTLDEAGATLVQATPSTWRLLLHATAPLPRVRALCGGEPMPPDVAGELPERVSELWNMYGPTETTVWSTCDLVRKDEPVSIGRPVPGTRIRVADPLGRPAPLGAPGEIWIGGAGVTDGYRGRPELTAERFVERDGERWYRTGDRGRWTGGGRLRHLGRLDRQLKLRGFRIEPGEVESVLNELPGVAVSVVATTSYGPTDERLVGYVVPAGGARIPTSTEVRREARKRLPDYMIPSLVVALDRVPTLPNGKVDVAALPAPARGAVAREEVGALREGAETDVAEIWRELLKVERIGPGDSFFDLGGHSLLAMQAVAAMQQRLGRPVEPRALYFQSLRQLVGDGS